MYFNFRDTSEVDLLLLCFPEHLEDIHFHACFIGAFTGVTMLLQLLKRVEQDPYS